MIEAQKEQTFSLGITVTVGLKKTSSNVYFAGAKVRALYRFKSQGYTSIILYSILYSVFVRFSIKQIVFIVFLRNFTNFTNQNPVFWLQNKSVFFLLQPIVLCRPK